MEPQKKTVLLVEDDKSIRELYALALINAGLHIIMAENGQDGVRIALEKHPDLVLLDIDMPIMNGYDAAAFIRNDEWGQTVPIIFLTNRSDPRDQAHASLQRPEHYIIKADTPMKEVIGQIVAAIA
ncbi:MAG: response regulator [Candidatus Pacebacteria bacterium]|nr:response regulator [Candidatus Paceibacterota bacterium]MBP9842919.1 response regulator [Candidatus Paceibacterota bacterium]